jgi:hypothetical protein
MRPHRKCNEGERYMKTGLAGLLVMVAALAGCGGGVEAAGQEQDAKAGVMFRAEAPVVISRSVGDLPAECTYTTSEGETLLAIDPVEPQHLQVVWLAGHWEGPNTGIAAESLDGGRHWIASAIPATGPCTGGGGHDLIDQWVSVGGDGHSYYYALSRDSDGPNTPQRAMRTLASAGARGGSWQPAAIVDDNLQGATGLMSRTSVTADPRVAGRAWAVWTRLLNPATDGVQVARTDDYGVTWQTPVTAARVPGGAAPAWQLLVLPSGDLALLYGEANTAETAGELLRGVTQDPPPITNRAVTSSDGGLTWSAPADIVTLPEFVVPRGAVGPDGRLYMVWSEAVDDAVAVRFASSDDGGHDWSAAGTVAQLHPGPLRVLDVQADVAVNAQGVIGVSFYAGAADGDQVTRWFAHSNDGGEHWKSLPLAPAFDYDTGTGGTWDSVFGAYQGLVAMNPGFGATFIASTGLPDDPTDVLFVRVMPGHP